jgi:phosphoribosylaminoimidazole-succinocarboxamide synthase
LGSVKDLAVIERPIDSRPGRGQFVFSDRYSVFDWGEMPDHIEGKGMALCLTTACFFERLEEMGIGSHYLGLRESHEVKGLAQLESPQSSMEIKLLRVLEPQVKDGTYDYSIYRKERVNFLIPLEIIYRNSLPEGSSVFNRLKAGSIKLEDLGLSQMPSPGQILDKPLIDVSTKLEASDRYLGWEEAREIAGLDWDELEKVKKITLVVDEFISREVGRVGLANEDGKIELGFDEKRNLILLDAVGTLDECRFTFESMPVSKEIARIFYRTTPWYQEVEEAKRKDKLNWKALVRDAPPNLPPKLRDLISQLYKASCNEITQRTWFPGVPSIGEILGEIRVAFPG